MEEGHALPFNRQSDSEFGKMKLCAMQHRNRDRAKGQQTSYSNGTSCCLVPFAAAGECERFSERCGPGRCEIGRVPSGLRGPEMQEKNSGRDCAIYRKMLSLLNPECRAKELKYQA